MAKVDFTLHGTDYNVACGAGEEARLTEIVKYINKRMDEIAKASPSASENRLLMMACLTLADEALDLRNKAMAAPVAQTTANEEVMVKAVAHLSQRVASIAERIGHA